MSTKTKSNQRSDTTTLPAAGLVTPSTVYDSVDACLSTDLLNDLPLTPKHLTPFRQSSRQTGRTVPRIKKTNIDDSADRIFGIKVRSNGKAADALSPEPSRSAMLDILQQQKEAIYLSNRRAPLGHSYVRGFDVPTDESHRFGITTKMSESAKNLLYPGTDGSGSGIAEEDHDVHARYVKTHGAYHPGEQMKRDYDWQKIGVSPADHRFGTANPPKTNAVAEALTNETPTVIVSSVYSDYSAARRASSGHARRLHPPTASDPTESDSRVFGMRTKKDDWDAARTIVGITVSESDNERETRTASRRLQRERDSGLFPADFRASTASKYTPSFSSIRRSKSALSNPLVDTEDVDAHRTLSAPRFDTPLVDDMDFHRPYPKNELRDILTGSGVVPLNESADSGEDCDVFEAVYRMAVSNDSEADVPLSIADWLNCYNQSRFV